MSPRGSWIIATWIALSLPAAAQAVYTFGDWATDQGYSPGDAMPEWVEPRFVSSRAIDDLSGIGDYDWTTTPTTTLELWGNQISSIESGAFSGLTNLESLRLNGNSISSIESGDFSGLASLTYLGLDDNQISSIESDDFNDLPNLAGLDLYGNQISSIEADDFSGLTNLRSLHLRNNQISSIEADAFSGMPNLEYLSVSYNQISSIEADKLSGLTNLRLLILNHNQISSIESDTLSGLPNLEWLYLHHNQISSIESGAFSGMPNLETLLLGSNILLTELNLDEADFSSLDTFTVVGNTNITSVSLKNTVLNQTALTALLDGGFDHRIGIGDLPSITELDLSGVDFAEVTDLSPLYAMDDLTGLWLVDVLNLDAIQLDLMLDELTTIEGTDFEGILYMTQTDFDGLNTAGGGLLADWHLELGHHVQIVTIPEPTTLALLAIASLCLVPWLRRRAAQ